MRVVFYSICMIFIVIYLSPTSCIEPLSTFSIISISTLASSLYFASQIRWPWQEKCGQKWTNFNANELSKNLDKHLFGQHLVNKAVINSIKAHISKKEPKKALVMAFHGWTGGGKNYVAKMLADALYDKGSKSEFVHWYIATKDFPHSDETKKYRDKLFKEITENTKKCGQSLFIFDEIDKISPGVLDNLKPFLDFYEDIDGIDYRKNIFIFLSNTGGSEITKVALNFWLEGKEREDIAMKDIESLINKGAFNEKGGLYHSEIIERNLIDVYVPFLPLERKHVRKCILSELECRELKLKKSTVDEIEEQLTYYPPEFQLYSSSGCKKVAQKMDIFGFDTDEES